eukprot:6053157-Alexandrium_andersonii.AAC.1
MRGGAAPAAAAGCTGSEVAAGSAGPLDVPQKGSGGGAPRLASGKGPRGALPEPPGAGHGAPVSPPS